MKLLYGDILESTDAKEKYNEKRKIQIIGIDKIYSIDNNYKNLEFLNNFRNFIIIIGPKERESYPNINIEIFDEISDRVFQNDQYILFKLK